MKNRHENASHAYAEKKTSRKMVGENMSRLLRGDEIKQISGARSGPSPRGPGH